FHQLEDEIHQIRGFFLREAAQLAVDGLHELVLGRALVVGSLGHNRFPGRLSWKTVLPVRLLRWDCFPAPHCSPPFSRTTGLRCQLVRPRSSATWRTLKVFFTTAAK